MEPCEYYYIRQIHYFESDTGDIIIMICMHSVVYHKQVVRDGLKRPIRSNLR